MKRKILAAAFFTMIGLMGTLNAQAPYKHSIGATVGNMQAISYKTFVTDHFAIQVDLGNKILCTNGEYPPITNGERQIRQKWEEWNFWDLELNPNFMYEGHFVAGLYGFAGGGVSLGYSWRHWNPVMAAYYTGWINYYPPYRARWDRGKFGVNAMLGLEYKLNIPLALQFDFRPGYGMFFNDVRNNEWHFFDWSVNAGVRYTF